MPDSNRNYMLNFSTPVVDLGKFNWELSAAERCEGFFLLPGFVLGVLKKRHNEALTFCIIKIITIIIWLETGIVILDK